jgi:hypothetical protein
MQIYQGEVFFSKMVFGEYGDFGKSHELGFGEFGEFGECI